MMEQLVCITKKGAMAMSLRIIDSIHIEEVKAVAGQSSVIDTDGNETQTFIEKVEPVPESWKVTVLVRFYDASCNVIETKMVLFVFYNESGYNSLINKLTTQPQIDYLYKEVRDKYNSDIPNTFQYITKSEKDDKNFIYERLTSDNINVCKLCKDEIKTLYYLNLVISE
jgi:hypothetical protein